MGEHEHNFACSFGSPTCPEFATPAPPIRHDDGEVEALAQTLFETAWGAATSAEHAERFLASDWLAARDAAVARAAWDEGYMRCSDHFESHANGVPVPEDPLATNPYRAERGGESDE